MSTFSEGDDDDIIETEVRYVSQARAPPHPPAGQAIWGRTGSYEGENRRPPALRNNQRIWTRDHRAASVPAPVAQNPLEDAQDDDVEIVWDNTTNPFDQYLVAYNSSEDEDYTDSGTDGEPDYVDDVLEMIDAHGDIFERLRDEIENYVENQTEEDVELVDSRSVRRNSNDDEVLVQRVSQVLPRPTVRAVNDRYSRLEEHLRPFFLHSMLHHHHYHGTGTTHQGPRRQEHFQEEVLEAIRRSLNEHSAPATIDPKQIKQKPVPDSARDGFTRGLDEKGSNTICAKCDVELGVGSQNPKASDVEIALSRRTFFLPCGHVYCGQCVANYRSRRLSAKDKKCVVEGCTQTGKKRGTSSLFRELYYN